MVLTRRDFVALTAGTLTLGASVTPAASASADTLSRRVVEIERDLSARLGVFVLDTQTATRFTHRADERFPMCSTFKLVAVGALLARVDEGWERLERRIRFEAGDVVAHSPVTRSRVGGDGMSFAELCEAALTASDNTAGNIVIDALNGVSGVTQFARSIGDRQTLLDRRETSLNAATPGDPRDTTTPAAMGETLRTLVLGDILSHASRERLAIWLKANRTGDTRLRAGVPGSWRVGDKTGSGGYGTTNDVAVLWPPNRAPIIVAVYLTETKASPKTRDAAIASIGQAIASSLPT